VIRSFDPGRKHKRSGINSLGSFAPRTHLSKPGHLLLSLSPYSSSVVVSFHFSYEVEGNLFNVVHPFLDLRGAIAPTSSGVRRPCAMALRFSTSSCLFREHIYQNPDISCHFRPLKARLSTFHGAVAVGNSARGDISSASRKRSGINSLVVRSANTFIKTRTFPAIFGHFEPQDRERQPVPHQPVEAFKILSHVRPTSGKIDPGGGADTKHAQACSSTVTS
jgi:hypothetical protein